MDPVESVVSSRGSGERSPWQRQLALWRHRAGRLDPTVKGLLWSTAAGFLFCLLNALMRSLTLQMDPFQSQFLRYLFGFLVLLPLVWHQGLAAYRTRRIGGPFTRGARCTRSGCTCGSSHCPRSRLPT